MLGGLPAGVQQTHCRYVCRTIVRITLTVKIKRGWEQNRETLRLGVGTFPVALPRLFPDRPIQHQDRDRILSRFDRLYFKAHGAGWSQSSIRLPVVMAALVFDSNSWTTVRMLRRLCMYLGGVESETKKPPNRFPGTTT